MNGCRAAIRVCAVIGLCALSREASAQRETGPYGDLFGGRPTGETEGKEFSLRWSTYGGYDHVTREQAQPLAADNDPYSSSGTFGELSGTISYSRRTKANSLSVYGSTSSRAYGGMDDVSAPAVSAGTSFSSGIGRRTSFGGSLFATRAPYSQLAPYATAGGDMTSPSISPSFGFAVAAGRTLAGGTAFGVVHRLSARSTLNVDGGWQRIQFEGGVAAENRIAQIRLTRNLAKGLAFRAGYGYQDARFATAAATRPTSEPTGPTSELTGPTTEPTGPTTGPTGPTTLHNLDVGVDFNRALSVSRRTKLSFGTGSSITRGAGRPSEFHLTGQATLSQEFGRTWTASALYSRGSYFAQGFRDLIFLDAFGANVGGQLGTRVQLSSGASYSFGIVGLGADAPSFGSYTGSARLSIGLSRRVGLSAQYLYYHYNAAQSATTIPGISPTLGRQSLMIGLSGWVPFINTRASRDSR